MTVEEEEKLLNFLSENTSLTRKYIAFAKTSHFQTHQIFAEFCRFSRNSAKFGPIFGTTVTLFRKTLIRFNSFPFWRKFFQIIGGHLRKLCLFRKVRKELFLSTLGFQ